MCIHISVGPDARIILRYLLDMKTDMMSADACIGGRIVSDGHFATVLFQGNIPSTKGEWLGVEWDDPCRGKHDGTHDGVKYFTTKHPTSGSFIRPKKAEIGCSLVEALKERYGLIQDDNAGVDVSEMFVMGKNQATTVEVVGAQSVNLRQSQFDRLLQVVLRDSLVKDAGKAGEIQQLIPNVTDLDLSRNLLASWESLARITEQLVNLASLNLSENRLQFPESSEELAQAFNSIKILYLNRMGYGWREVLQCLDLIRGVQNIHACFNQITTIPSTGPNMDNVKLINLESNPLAGWDQILVFAKLQNLETLILNDTGIENLEIPDVLHGETSQLFVKLNSLSISKNKISKWSCIDELNKLSSLTEVYFRRNPLLSNYNDDTNPRTIAIAKVAGMKIYNRAKVELVERKGAELDYMKIYGIEWKASGGHQDPTQNKPSTEFTKEHPRYQHFIDKYGALEDSELITVTSALKNSLISVTIHIPASHSKPPLKKRLPLSMTVQKLKLLVQRLYKVNPPDMVVTYTSMRMPGPEIKMDSDQKEIGFYSIEDGDKVHIKWG